jgi:acyl-CoA synthetase (AMP-forming)/AMP-acid ligase II/acyl carrier protein
MTLAQTVPGLLAARATAEPDRTALLVPGGSALTFGAWSAWSAVVARDLQARGVRPGDRIGLSFAGRDWVEYAVGYCGVQLAGGVAVPLSAQLPPAETGRLLAHCAAAGLLVGAGAGPAEAGCWVAGLPSRPTEPAGADRAGPEVQPGDLAQILYTSGTTGRPKGVAASHANLTHGCDPAPRLRRYGHSRHFLHAFPIGTNAGQMMLVDALVARPAAVAAARFAADEFCALIEAYRVGTVFLVPSMAIDLLNSGAAQRHDLTSVLLLSSSAAALPGAVAAGLAAAFPNATVVNHYTSTEAVPAVTTMVFDPARPASVGRPAAGQSVMIADPAGRPLPAGAVGSVWLRHPGAPRAYYADPAASAAVFRAGWVRMGDLGRLDAEGHLYLIDRDSDVVTSGGYQVSTLQVEAALQEHPAVAEAAAFGLPHPVLGALVAAAVTVRSPVTASELRAFLAGRLARHETPMRLLVLDALPRNEAGKVLKRELRATFAQQPAPVARPEPAGPVAAALAELWRRVLRVRDAGGADDFFALGGDSLSATQLATLATEEFGVAVSPALAFEVPVLAAQAAWIAARATAAPAVAGAAAGRSVAGGSVAGGSVAGGSAAGGSAAGPPVGGSAATGSAAALHTGPVEVPLSSLQEYFLRWMHETAPPRAVSAVTVAVRVTDPLDLPVLDGALRAVAARHDALRTVFRPGAGGHRAVVLTECPPETVHLDAAAEPARPTDLADRAGPVDPAGGHRVGADPAGGGGAVLERAAARLAAAAVQRPFDVAAGPLARAVTVRLGERDHVLALAVHHLVADGASMGVLLGDLAVTYSALRAGRQPPAPRPAPPAGEVSAWARRRWPATRAYWRRMLAGASPALPAPGRAVTDRFTAAALPVELPAELAARFRLTAREHGATAYMAVLAAWAQVLAEWSGAPEVVLMSPVPGRVRPEFAGVVGCLVQSLLLRVDLRGGPAFGELLRRVRGVVLAAIEHQHYPYREFSRQVPDPAWLRYERWPGQACFPGLASGPFELPRELMFDWPLPPGEVDRSVPELALTEQPDGSMAGWLVYNRRAYQPAAVAALGERLRALSEDVLARPVPAGAR